MGSSIKQKSFSALKYMQSFKMDSYISIGLLIFASTSGIQGQSILCVMTHCLSEITECAIDTPCMDVLMCLKDCDPDDATCPYGCGMGGEAGKNPHFINLLYCMVDNNCMGTYEDSGACLAEDDQALDLTDYDLVAGDWWTVWGQNCGQTDQWGEWSGAMDWIPCSHARFLQLDDGEWINNTTFCANAGSGDYCEGTPLVTIPKVYWTNPGVLRHDYPQSEAPIVPQIEDWKWLWISEDNQWSVVVWCGYNPMLEYNGAFVLSRSRSDGTLPADLEPTIREQLTKYGMNLDEMCLINSLECDPNP